MTIRPELLDELLKDYQTPQDLFGENGILKQLTKGMIERCLRADYKNRLLGKNVDSRSVAAISWQYLFGPLSYLIVFGVAWINTPACIILSFILALFFAIPGPALRSLPEKVEIRDYESEEQ